MDVVLVDLVTSNDLNGCCGVVVGEKGNRVMVELNSGRRIRAQRKNVGFVVALPDNTDVTASVFHSDHVKVVEVNGNRRVVAVAKVQAGEVVMVEHTLSACDFSVQFALADDKGLAEHLHPRGGDDYAEKMATNWFNSNNAYAPTFHSDGRQRLMGFIGLRISMFNHADTYNCVTSPIRLGASAVTFGAVTTNRAISTGEELTIDYSTGYKASFVANIVPNKEDALRKLNEVLEAAWICVTSEVVKSSILTHVASLHKTRLLLNQSECIAANHRVEAGGRHGICATELATNKVATIGCYLSMIEGLRGFIDGNVKLVSDFKEYSLTDNKLLEIPASSMDAEGVLRVLSEQH